MVDVLNCGADGGKLHRIDDVKVNPQVAVGDQYTILVTHSTDAWINKAYCRLSLWDGGQNLAQSGSIVVNPRESVITKFIGTMPNHSMYLKVSLQAEILGFVEECQDGQELFIKLAPTNEGTTPIDVEEPEPPGEDETIMDWIMDNIVLILMLILIIILVIKFG